MVDYAHNFQFSDPVPLSFKTGKKMDHGQIYAFSFRQFPNSADCGWFQLMQE